MKGFRYLAKEKISKTPNTNGIYTLASLKETLYIGKAVNLRERIKNHFHTSSYRDNLFIDKVTRVGWLETQSDIDALLLESKLIKEYQPKYNVMWKDDKGYFYVGITREQFPRVFLTHQIRNSNIEIRNKSKIQNFKTQARVSDFGFRISDFDYIGPFVEGKAVKQVLRFLRRVFPYYTAKRHPMLPCPYCHIGLCPGPKPDVKGYKQNIKNLVAVLRGRRVSVLKNLKKAMGRASKEQDFERATKLRDQVFALERVFSHSAVIFWRSPKFYGDTEKELQKLFHRKRKFSRIEAYDISNIQGYHSTGSMVTFLNGEPAKEWYRKFKIHPVIRPGAPSNDGAHPNDFAMMEELISRRLKHTEWPYPDLMLIDGGKGQLTAALQALRKSEIQNPKSEILLAALAKRNNELFSQKRTNPILLKDLPQKVSNLLLHIRDEAHRFAVSYHRKLRRVDALKSS